jgi:hypothetical protein
MKPAASDPSFLDGDEDSLASPPKEASVEAAPEEVLELEASFCPTCGERADAVVVERKGKVYQRTLCPAHRGTENLIFSDSRLHRKLSGWNQRVFSAATEDEDPDKAPLLAVIDLTNRCDSRCPVCFAEVSDKNGYHLELETVRRMLRSLVERQPQPCRHVQFSGGEPTLHPQFLEILQISREMGFNHIQVATNGHRFADLDFARRCAEAGLQTLYLQFDGMNDEVYLALRGRKLLERKLRAFENIASTNMRVVLVPTIVSGINVDQLGPIFRFAVEHSRHVTGISLQPLAATGRVKVDRPPAASFNLADMAAEFGRQTGLTRVPEDWFPLNALTLLTRGISRARGEGQQHPACDAHCSMGTYFHVGDDGRATCVTRFLDLDRFLRSVGELPKPTGGFRDRISGLKQLHLLSSCFDASQAPRGLTFLRLLRGLDGWEDKTVGRSRWWFRRGFDGLFVAGMHFMDSANYSLRRVRRCIIKYVNTDGTVVSFCRYNAGDRARTVEESARLAAPPGT